MAAPWFASWFDSPHYHALYGYRDEAEAARFVDTLIDRLRPRPDADVLDLGCGAGRHSKRLAAKGLRVTGMDLSAASIAEARRFEQPGLRFVRQDMRAPFGVQAFDYVVSFFTSFGYFDDPADDVQAVSNMASALRPCGTLVLDYLNVHHAARRQMARETAIVGSTAYHITRWNDARHFFKRIQIDEGRRPVSMEFVEKVAKFDLHDFRAMFAPHDLEIEQVFGDYALNPFDPATSPRLMLLARKGGAVCSAPLAA